MNAVVDTPTKPPRFSGVAEYKLLGLLAPSPTNPRKRFIPAKLQELAESIKKHEVFQPILVRPNPAHREGNGQPPFEIVCGERRYRASKMAEVEGIPCIVRDLSDIEALEIQLLENIDRDDLHPLEEADGLKQLMDAADGAQGYASVEEIAAKIGKSRRWVYLRLALLNLCESARTAFLDDAINASVAGLIARMPDKQQQAEATKRILEGFGGEPLPVRAASTYLREHFMLDLAKAPFDVTRIYATESGPIVACSECPKRSGANPDLFDDVKSGDLCQDSACFHLKEDAEREVKFEHARAAGHTVLRGRDAARLMPGQATVLPPGYVWFDEPCTALTADKRPLAEIFGAKQRGVFTLEHPVTEAIVRLVKEDDARKLLKTKGLLRSPVPAAAPSSAREEQSAAALAPAPRAATPPPEPIKPQPRSATALKQEIEGCSGNFFSELLFKKIGDSIRAAPEPPLRILRTAIDRLLNDASNEAFTVIFDAHGWNHSGTNTYWEHKLREHLQEASGAELAVILAEALIAEDLTNGWDKEWLIDEVSDVVDIAKVLEVDLDAIQGEANDEARQFVLADEAKRRGVELTPDATDAFLTAHAAPPAAKAAAPKYRNPATGETWSGRGLQPKWLKVAIAEDGKKLEDFAL